MRWGGAARKERWVENVETDWVGMH
jgi:hypothetical protein